MSETKAPPKPWTEGEKLGILFQIIERSGPIPWDDLKLPDGRTKKAVQVMIDKEKTKMKKAREAIGEESPSKGVKNKKATSDDGGSEDGSPKKKPRIPHKKKESAKLTASAKKPAQGGENDGVEDDDALIKDEVAGLGSGAGAQNKKVAG
ncbi:hypothetical protein M433DRAFT_154417 [Acidomyces richmondensis BFW]|nr:MAG: hypothetical protein FE78DRAFT_91126 [Acidomyces sp. 'richmondensis']KYG45546.1 hypothetical protein M433DRAFT_154417 [Acidomyces richmondensis BFW]